MPSLINHLTIGVSNYGRSKTFYQAILGALGYKPLVEIDGLTGLGDGAEPSLWINSNASPTSGVHICFNAHSQEEVQAFYGAALKLGAKDNGVPGLRTYTPDYYAAYVIDQDGYRLEAVFHTGKN